jgi:hypothetical protein
LYRYGKESKRAGRKKRKLIENARPDMIGGKSIALKMRDGAQRKPFKVSDSIKVAVGIISCCECEVQRLQTSRQPFGSPHSKGGAYGVKEICEGIFKSP